MTLHCLICRASLLPQTQKAQLCLWCLPASPDQRMKVLALFTGSIQSAEVELKRIEEMLQ